MEDNGVLCYSLEQALLEARCEVIGPYARLAEAMEQAPHQHIDLALLDINLRGEFVSPLAELLRRCGVPFVLASAYHSRELPEELQGEAQLRKPFTDNELLLKLARCR
jgi:two-component SAPR family response regulator